MLALRERGVFVKQEKKKIVILIKKKLLFREKASFTVEASLIMMTVLMAVFMCIYYGFRGSIVAYSAKSDAFGDRKQ